MQIHFTTREAELLHAVAKAAAVLDIPAFAVGGFVRDKILDRPTKDIDIVCMGDGMELAQEFAKLFKPLPPVSLFKTFGTAQVKFQDIEIEFVGARKESYSRDSRKPQVAPGTIEDDQNRRDFTINALAVELSDAHFGTIIDPFGGLLDLDKGILKTPLAPDQTFDDDPLRMMRAARFAAQLNFEIAPEALSAMKDMAERINIISAERIRDEFIKLLMSNNPRAGISILVATGLAELVLPEIPKLQLEIDEHHHHKDVYEHSLTVLEQAISLENRLHGKNLVIRLAALLHDIGKPKTRALIAGGGVSFHHHEVVGARLAKERLKKLRFSNEVIEEVETLISLHLRFHGYGDGEWTDSAVRRYVRDAGDLLTHLHVLTRADCTTRNQRKAERLAKTYDELEARIDRLAEEEELAAIRPDLDGAEVMQLLNLKPSREVGLALDFLLELRLEEGPLRKEVATEKLLNWWKSR